MVLRRTGAFLFAALIAAVAANATPKTVGAATSVPSLDHVFVIVMENHSYGQIIGSSSAPYVNSLLGSGALAATYHAVAHPSLPNYIALTSGSTYGITTDCTTCWLGVANVADRLESAGSTWKAYQESMPSACFVGDSYPYVQKHDPFIYYNDIRTNPTRCKSHVVPYSALAGDLKSTATTPNFGFITPNACDDMHDCSVATGDAWLSHQVPMLLGSPAFTTQHSLLAITWDEDDFTTSNQVATIFLGAGVSAGHRSGVLYSHYSLLHTIEAARGLSTLTSNDADAWTMADMFSASSATACDNAGLSASPASPQHPGTAEQLGATSTQCPNPEFEFWVLPPGATWRQLAPYSTSSTFAWSTAGMAPGTYRLAVWARDAASPGLFSNSMGTYDAFDASLLFTLAAGCTGVTASVSPVSATLGVTVALSGIATGCPNISPLYEFWLLKPGGVWQLVQPYSAASSIGWSSVGQQPGSYRVSVWVRDAASSGTFTNPLGGYDAFDASNYLTVTPACGALNVSVAPASPAVPGTQVTVSAAASCVDASPLYEFWVLPPGGGSWLAQAYSTSGALAWNTAGDRVGSYRFSVWVRDAGDAGAYSNVLGSYDAFNAAQSFMLN